MPPRSQSNQVRSAANRAAWLYWNRKLTQQQIADRLGISRASVIRLIEEARVTGEVQVILEPGQESDIPTALELEERLGLVEAVVVPPSPEPSVAVGRALGSFLSQVVSSGMTVGVGWGRTLDAALTSFVPNQLQNVTVCSLLGGLIELNTRNPVEFAWRFAEAANARCLLMLSPLVVDSDATRQKLINGSDLAFLFSRMQVLDLAIVGCGDATTGGHSRLLQAISPASQRLIETSDAVAEILCQFLDEDGREIHYPEVNRLMASPLETIDRAGTVVLAGGGAARARAMVAACKRFKRVTLLTDSPTAKAMLSSI